MRQAGQDAHGGKGAREQAGCCCLLPPHLTPPRGRGAPCAACARTSPPPLHTMHTARAAARCVAQRMAATSSSSSSSSSILELTVRHACCARAHVCVCAGKTTVTQPKRPAALSPQVRACGVRVRASRLRCRGLVVEQGRRRGLPAKGERAGRGEQDGTVAGLF